VSRSVPECARFREQAARIAVALFADTAKLLLPPARALPRHEPDLGREIPRRAERLRISDAGNQSRGQRRTNTRNLIEPPARLAGSVPSIDHTVKFQDPQLEQPELGAETTGYGFGGFGPFSGAFRSPVGRDPSPKGPHPLATRNWKFESISPQQTVRLSPSIDRK